MVWASVEYMQLYPKKKGHLCIPDTFSFLFMYLNFWLFADDEVFRLFSWKTGLWDHTVCVCICLPYFSSFFQTDFLAKIKKGWKLKNKTKQNNKDPTWLGKITKGEERSAPALSEERTVAWCQFLLNARISI